LARGLGLEPRFSAPEADVLPIAPSPNCLLYRLKTRTVDCLLIRRHRLLHASLHHISDGGSAQVVEEHGPRIPFLGRLGHNLRGLVAGKAPRRGPHLMLSVVATAPYLTLNGSCTLCGGFAGFDDVPMMVTTY
jgi:uncharacterized protein (DUF2249 family)